MVLKKFHRKVVAFNKFPRFWLLLVTGIITQPVKCEGIDEI